MEKISYLKNHSLGYFNPYNPDYQCMGMMNHRLAVFAYKEEDSYMQIDVIDVWQPERENLTRLKRVFELELDLSECNAWSVVMARVDQEYRGHGFAPHLYRWVMMQTGIILQAGETQSPGGRSIWHAMAGMKDVIVYGKTLASELIQCDPSDYERDIVADGVVTYDGTGDDYFTCFACYSK
jgi:hypothetical protein